MKRKIRIVAGLGMSILLLSARGLKAQDYSEVEGGNNGLLVLLLILLVLLVLLLLMIRAARRN